MILFSISIFFSSYFCLGNLWKYLEKEYGLLTSCLTILLIVFTIYGIYVYIKNSLYNELKMNNFLIGKNFLKNQDKKNKLSVSERYYEEKQRCLNSEKVSFFNRTTNETIKSIDNNLKVTTQSSLDNFQPEYSSSSDRKTCFFGINMNTPSRKSAEDEISKTNTLQESCSPSILANTFIAAASIAKNYQNEMNIEGNNTLNNRLYSQEKLGNQNLLNSSKFTLQTRNSKIKIINSIKSSFHSNIESAKNRFGDYLSSLQNSISTKKRRNSFPSNFTTNGNTSNSGNQKNMSFGTVKVKSTYKNNFIQLLKDPVKEIGGNTSTPIRKIYQGFSSPLPTGKTSPLLLLSERKR